jgi:hypothetical protein
MPTDQSPSLDDLAEAILRYISSPDTDYALMINGQWGSGKTYFWRSSIESELRAQSKPFVYVSLFGVTGAPDIDWRIVEEIYPLLKSKAGKAGSFLARWFANRHGLPLEHVSYRSFLKDYILCFDDIERADCPKPLVIGHLNRLVEHDGRKMLLIANETEIAKDDPYWKIKEKLVGRTFRFQISPEQAVGAILKGFVGTHAETHIALLKEELTFVVRASKTTNLRTIRAAAEASIFLLVAMSPSDQQNDRLCRAIVKLSAAICFETKRDVQKATLLKGLFMDRAALYWVLYSREPAKNPSSPDSEEEQVRRFVDDYFNGHLDDVPSIPAIYKYVLDGLFHAADYRDEIKLWAGTAKEDVLTPEDRFLRDIWSLSEDEISRTATTLIHDVQGARQRSPTMLIRHLTNLLYCAQKEIIPPSTPESIAAVFTNALEELHSTRQLDYAEMGAPDFLYGTGNTDPIVVAFANRLTNIAKEHDAELAARSIDKLFDLLSDQPQKFVAEIATALDEDQRFTFTPIFAKYPPTKAGGRILALSAKDIIRIARAFNHRYQRIANIRDTLGSEYDNLRTLHEYLGGVMLNESPLKKAALEQLRDQIHRAIEKLKL